MSESKSIIMQNQFGDYCRTGHDLDVNVESKEAYRSMVLTNFDSALRNTYPLTSRALGEEKWTEFIHDFVLKFKCQEPQFWKMPFSLITHEDNSQWGTQNGMNWLNDALRFEWCQFELFYRKDWLPVDFKDFNGNLNVQLVLHNEFEIVQLSYPIHHEKWEGLDEHEGSFFILLYRDQDDFKVKMMELTPFLAVLTEQLTLQQDTVANILENILVQNEIEPTDEIFAFCLDYILKLEAVHLVKGEIDLK